MGSMSTPLTDEKERQVANQDERTRAHYGWKFARHLELQLAEADWLVDKYRSQIGQITGIGPHPATPAELDRRADEWLKWSGGFGVESDAEAIAIIRAYRSQADGFSAGIEAAAQVADEMGLELCSEAIRQLARQPSVQPNRTVEPHDRSKEFAANKRLNEIRRQEQADIFAARTVEYTDEQINMLLSVTWVLDGEDAPAWTPKAREAMRRALASLTQTKPTG